MKQINYICILNLLGDFKIGGQLLKMVVIIWTKWWLVENALKHLDI
jgi:hypothetical protein